jgi:hypothetical protein
MSIEGGMSGNQKRFVCPNCGKIFFAWRPDTAPGVKIKCYFCKKEMEDEASKRTPPAPPPAPPAEGPKSNVQGPKSEPEGQQPPS